jgi:hypothetical protein
MEQLDAEYFGALQQMGPGLDFTTYHVRQDSHLGHREFTWVLDLDLIAYISVPNQL